METDIHALIGVAPEVTPSDFVSQNYETLATLIREEAKRGQTRASNPDLTLTMMMKHLHRAIERRGAREIAADTLCLIGSEGKWGMMKKPTQSIWKSVKRMDSAPMSMLGLVGAGFMTGLGEGIPQVKALQAQTLMTTGARAEEDQARTLVIAGARAEKA